MVLNKGPLRHCSCISTLRSFCGNALDLLLVTLSEIFESPNYSTESQTSQIKVYADHVILVEISTAIFTDKKHVSLHKVSLHFNEYDFF